MCEHSHTHIDVHTYTNTIKYKVLDLYSVMHVSVCRARPVSGLDSIGINRKLSFYLFSNFLLFPQFK